MSATHSTPNAKPALPIQAPFCLLAENRFAFTATQLLSVLDAPFAPWMVYLYGPSGCGKTHLARLFEHEFLTHHPMLCVRHVSCHEFIQDLHESFSRGTVSSFRDDFGQADAIILEDVHTIERSPKAQEVLQSALDQFLTQGTRVLMTSRKSPGDLVGILPRMRNRLRSGIVASVEMPASSARKMLLAHFAGHAGSTLDAEVINTLAELVPGSPRELDAVLKQLYRVVQTQTVALDVAFVRSFLLRERDQFEPTIAQIAGCVATQCGVTVKAMRSRERHQKVAGPRQTAIWLARQLTDLSLKRIGEYFHLTNHTTVMHAIKVVEQRRAESAAYDHELHRLRQKIVGLPAKPR